MNLSAPKRGALIEILFLERSRKKILVGNCICTSRLAMEFEKYYYSEEKRAKNKTLKMYI